MMQPLNAGLFVFAVFFGAALIGVLLNPALEERHLSDESVAILHACRGIVIALATLTLGLLVSSARESFEKKTEELKAQAAYAIALNNILLDYGPDSAAARQALSHTLRWEINQINAAATENVDAEAAIGKGTREKLRPEILRLNPQNENQRLLRESALGVAQKVLLGRWQIYVDLASTFQRPLGGLLIFWLVTIFFSFGLLSPRNIIVIGGLVLASLSTAGAIFMILELDMPFHGLINISPRPLELALEQTLLTN